MGVSVPTSPAHLLSFSAKVKFEPHRPWIWISIVSLTFDKPQGPV